MTGDELRGVTTPGVATDADSDSRASGGDRHRTVLGRQERHPGGPVAPVGVHRAPDGTDGGPVAVDLDRPHVVLVVGKRGYGKSYTMGVIAEGLARTPGVAPVVVDPMGAFGTLSGPADGAPVPSRVVDRPRVPAGAVDPPGWPRMVGLDPESGAGALVWRAATAGEDLAGMRRAIDGAETDRSSRLAARNHLDLVDGWDVFDPGGIRPADLGTGAVTVLDAGELGRAPLSALVRATADGLYEARVAGDLRRLPWLLVDEAHAAFEGVAGPALERIATRGRQPGVSLVLATQRPAAVPDAVVSQADLVLAHRLTARPDLAALERARPSYAPGPFAERMPAAPGEATVVDDATESVHQVRVRERDTPDGSASPRASDVAPQGDTSN